ncbi:hypothetical protein ACFL4A_00070 [bacterium]
MKKFNSSIITIISLFVCCVYLTTLCSPVISQYTSYDTLRLPSSLNDNYLSELKSHPEIYETIYTVFREKDKKTKPIEIKHIFDAKQGKGTIVVYSTGEKEYSGVVFEFDKDLERYYEKFTKESGATISIAVIDGKKYGFYEIGENIKPITDLNSFEQQTIMSLLEIDYFIINKIISFLKNKESENKELNAIYDRLVNKQVISRDLEAVKEQYTKLSDEDKKRIKDSINEEKDFFAKKNTRCTSYVAIQSYLYIKDFEDELSKLLKDFYKLIEENYLPKECVSLLKKYLNIIIDFTDIESETWDVTPILRPMHIVRYFFSCEKGKHPETALRSLFYKISGHELGHFFDNCLIQSKYSTNSLIREYYAEHIARKLIGKSNIDIGMYNQFSHQRVTLNEFVKDDKFEELYNTMPKILQSAKSIDSHYAAVYAYADGARLDDRVIDKLVVNVEMNNSEYEKKEVKFAELYDIDKPSSIQTGDDLLKARAGKWKEKYFDHRLKASNPKTALKLFLESIRNKINYNLVSDRLNGVLPQKTGVMEHFLCFFGDKVKFYIKYVILNPDCIVKRYRFLYEKGDYSSSGAGMMDQDLDVEDYVEIDFEEVFSASKFLLIDNSNNISKADIEFLFLYSYMLNESLGVIPDWLIPFKVFGSIIKHNNDMLSALCWNELFKSIIPAAAELLIDAIVHANSLSGDINLDVFNVTMKGFFKQKKTPNIRVFENLFMAA